MTTDLSAMTTDELIAASTYLDDRADGLLARLGAITARARGAHGIEVTVNLEGMLVGLELGESPRTLAAAALSAEIERLVQEASVTALTDGLALLEPFAGPALTAELAQLTGLTGSPSPAPRPRPAPPEEDFSEQTWELRD
ncbi:hypothetical protein [Actinokineospora sp.]|uniref:hypothetical protein n=1 Tax=Actinokineospora sp. TaxID=1872133 RepID=UPI004037C61C